MDDHITLVFDDEADDFGNQTEFTVLRYDYDFENDVDERPNSDTNKVKFNIEIEVQYTTNLAIVGWGMAHLSRDGMLKYGNLITYNYTDGSQKRNLRFEKAECVHVRAGGTHVDKVSALEKTMVLRFAAKAMAVDGVTIYGELRASRQTAVEPTVHEEDQEGVFEEYYLTDAEDKKISALKIGSSVLLHIVTKNMINQRITLPIPNTKVDFKYNGKRLENDTLEDYLIKRDLEKVELEVIAPLEEDDEDMEELTL